MGRPVTPRRSAPPPRAPGQRTGQRGSLGLASLFAVTGLLVLSLGLAGVAAALLALGRAQTAADAAARAGARALGAGCGALRTPDGPAWQAAAAYAAANGAALAELAPGAGSRLQATVSLDLPLPFRSGGVLAVRASGSARAPGLPPDCKN